jgi:hypothetical protein
MSELPDWSHSPLRQRAAKAMNVRSSPPVVEIRCTGQYRGRSCGALLGGAFPTGLGTVVALAHLTSRDSAKRYKEMMRRPEERLQLLREEGYFSGYIEEEPVMLIFDGECHLVPGAENHDYVRCTRHGSWPLDLEGVARKVQLSTATKRREAFGTTPPS